jgi:ATP-binding cassette subfamily B protein
MISNSIISNSNKSVDIYDVSDEQFWELSAQYIGMYLYPAIKSEMSEDVLTYLQHHSYDIFQNTFTGSLTKQISDLVEVENIVNIPNEWFIPRLLALIIASVTLYVAVHPN